MIVYSWPELQGNLLTTALAVLGKAIETTLTTTKNGSVNLKNFEMLNIALSPSYDDRESGIAQKVCREPTLGGVIWRGWLPGQLEISPL